MDDLIVGPDEGGGLKYFSAIPNLADEELDPYEMRLFVHYVRVCGRNNRLCREDGRETAQKCKMSHGMLIKVRRSLRDKRYVELGNVRIDGVMRVVVRLTQELWDRNMLYFARQKMSNRQLSLEEMIQWQATNNSEPEILPKDDGGDLKKEVGHTVTTQNSKDEFTKIDGHTVTTQNSKDEFTKIDGHTVTTQNSKDEKKRDFYGGILADRQPLTKVTGHTVNQPGHTVNQPGHTVNQPGSLYDHDIYIDRVRNNQCNNQCNNQDKEHHHHHQTSSASSNANSQQQQQTTDDDDDGFSFLAADCKEQETNNQQPTTNNQQLTANSLQQPSPSSAAPLPSTSLGQAPSIGSGQALGDEPGKFGLIDRDGQMVEFSFDEAMPLCLWIMEQMGWLGHRAYLDRLDADKFFSLLMWLWLWDRFYVDCQSQEDRRRLERDQHNPFGGVSSPAGRIIKQIQLGHDAPVTCDRLVYELIEELLYQRELRENEGKEITDGQ